MIRRCAPSWRRIVAEPHPEAVMESTEHFFADVEVTTTSGETFRTYVDRPLGRDRAHPLPPGALETKFRDCAAPVIADDAARAIEAAILGLELQADIRTIGDVMRDGVARYGAAPRCVRLRPVRKPEPENQEEIQE